MSMQASLGSDLIHRSLATMAAMIKVPSLSPCFWTSSACSRRRLRNPASCVHVQPSKSLANGEQLFIDFMCQQKVSLRDAGRLLVFKFLQRRDCSRHDEVLSFLLAVYLTLVPLPPLPIQLFCTVLHCPQIDGGKKPCLPQSSPPRKNSLTL